MYIKGAIQIAVRGKCFYNLSLILSKAICAYFVMALLNLNLR